MKQIVLSLLLFWCLNITSQNNKTLSLKLIKKSLEKIEIKDTYFLKTKKQFLLQNWDSVLIFSSKAILNLKNKKALNYCYYMRGYSFMKKNIPNEAIREFQQISKEFHFYFQVEIYKGAMFIKKNKFKKAISYFESLQRFPDSIHKLYNKGLVLNDLGISFFHLSNYKKAEYYLQKAISLHKKKNDTLSLILAYTNLANVNYEQYKDNLAIPYFEKAYQLSKITNDFEMKRKTALNMAVVEENRKNLTKALSYRKEHERWKDSINNQQKIWDVAQFEKKLAVNEKEKQIKILETENKLKSSQRNNLIISSSLLILLLILGSFFYVQKSKSHKIIDAQKKELAFLNKTKDKLFSIVSHDLRSSVNLMQRSNSKLIRNIENENYNSLSTIANKNALIATTTYNLLENLLNWATLQTKSTYFNIESLELSSILKQIEFNYRPLFEDKNINFIIEVEQPTFIKADLDSLKIILRNLLDNAIKFTSTNGNIHCKTMIPEKDNTIYLYIEDNGCGMDTDTISQLLKETPLLNKKKNQQEIGTGLGIQLCKTLTAKNNASFNIESEINKGTKIIIGFSKA